MVWSYGTFMKHFKMIMFFDFYNMTIYILKVNNKIHNKLVSVMLKLNEIIKKESGIKTFTLILCLQIVRLISTLLRDNFKLFIFLSS